MTKARLAVVDPPDYLPAVVFQWTPQSLRRDGQAQVDEIDREQAKAVSVFTGTTLHTLQLSGVVWDARRSGAPADLEAVRVRLHRMTLPVGGPHGPSDGPPVVRYHPWGYGLDWTVTVDWRDMLRAVDGRLLRMAVDIRLQEWRPPQPAETPARTAADRIAANPNSGPQRQEGDDTVTVESGDTLSSIAADVYGDAGLWQRIFDANELRSGDPDLIFPGEELTIPRGGDRGGSSGPSLRQQIERWNSLPDDERQRRGVPTDLARRARRELGWIVFEDLSIGEPLS